ncbi:hypothetical protein Q3V23_05385 [Streptomyces sp. VNUA116]|uniref:hypothetical protein n=1 Tax=Streptomyces sp. VNUA116 TaxID=3062449 RepID=UPI0026757AD5|nr:hypothetical protein [Streptomyces sp. VNUA116]WKU43564.1 hypothetical protein Q3V23_05385 [Streptomyces sp. VNUA116]
MTSGMTSFDKIYDQPDPRAYFTVLGPLEYQTPHHAQAVFRRMAETRRATAATEPLTVVDICCSYGINAALLNHDVTMDELYTRYTSPQVAPLTTAELIEDDRAYFAARRRPGAARVVGIDVASQAVSYARAVGLLDEGFAENLETAEPSPELLRQTRRVRLITITGGTTFLSARTLKALTADTDEPAWVASFVLRTASYAPISDALAAHGLHTEKYTALTFPQRHFSGPEEQAYAVAAVEAAGEDPRGKETEGYFHTTLYLSRPAEDAASQPLEELLADV